MEQDKTSIIHKQPSAEDEVPSTATVLEQQPEGIKEEVREEVNEESKKDLSVDTPKDLKRTAPKFPSPSECSKWLMLYWFAGFPVSKIRWLLSQYFKLEGHDAYKANKIESTFRKLQQNADRNNPDFYSEPYMYYIMTSKSSSPFEFRQSATRYLDKHHPNLVEEMTEDDEITEMAAWHARWFEEVRLMHQSRVSIYVDRADTFEEKLNHYTSHFGAKGHVAYLEDESSKKGSKRANNTKPPSRTPSQSSDKSTNSEPLHSFADDVPRQNISRPKLKLRTKVEQFFGRSKQEGTPTPSTAQHLDDLGFFSRRPKKSGPGSIIEPRSRTPSLSSTEDMGESATSANSLQAHFESQRRPSQAS